MSGRKILLLKTITGKMLTVEDCLGMTDEELAECNPDENAVGLSKIREFARFSLEESELWGEREGIEFQLDELKEKYNNERQELRKKSKQLGKQMKELRERIEEERRRKKKEEEKPTE
jgi:tRNA(Ile)-lysidine synthase TilS/MesJ